MFNGSPLDKRPLWYSNPVGEKTPVVDEWGNETGETSQTWSDPAKLMLNVRPPYWFCGSKPFWSVHGLQLRCQFVQQKAQHTTL